MIDPKPERPQAWEPESTAEEYFLFFALLPITLPIWLWLAAGTWLRHRAYKRDLAAWHRRQLDRIEASKPVAAPPPAPSLPEPKSKLDHAISVARAFEAQHGRLPDLAEFEALGVARTTGWRALKAA